MQFPKLRIVSNPKQKTETAAKPAEPIDLLIVTPERARADFASALGTFWFTAIDAVELADEKEVSASSMAKAHSTGQPLPGSRTVDNMVWLLQQVNPEGQKAIFG